MKQKYTEFEKRLLQRLGAEGGKTAARRMSKAARQERARKGGVAAAARSKERAQ